MLETKSFLDNQNVNFGWNKENEIEVRDIMKWYIFETRKLFENWDISQEQYGQILEKLKEIYVSRNIGIRLIKDKIDDYITNVREKSIENRGNLKTDLLLDRYFWKDKINDIEKTIDYMRNMWNNEKEKIEFLLKSPIAEEIFKYLIIKKVLKFEEILKIIGEQKYKNELIIFYISLISTKDEASDFFNYLVKWFFDKMKDKLEFKKYLNNITELLIKDKLSDWLRYVNFIPEPYAEKILRYYCKNPKDWYVYDLLDFILNKLYIKDILYELSINDTWNFLSYLQKSDKAKSLPYIKDLLNNIFQIKITSEPEIITCYWDLVMILPNSDQIFEEALPLIFDKYPEAILYSSDILSDKQYANEYIEKSIKWVLENKPWFILDNADKIKKLKNWWEIIKEAVKKSSSKDIILNCKKLVEYTDIYSNIEQAFKEFSYDWPWEALIFIDILRKILKNKNIEDYFTIEFVLKNFEKFNFDISKEEWSINKYNTILEKWELIDAISYFGLFEQYIQKLLDNPSQKLTVVLQELEKKDRFLKWLEKKLTEKYNIRPRKYFWLLDWWGDTWLTEKLFLKSLDEVVKNTNKKLKEHWFDIIITKEELATNFLAEWWVVSLSSNAKKFSAFSDLGIDTYGDRLKNSQLLQLLTPNDLKDFSKFWKYTNEKDEEVSTYEFSLALDTAVLLSANMYILKKYLLFRDLKSMWVDILKLSDETLFFWTTYYFNSWEWAGKKAIVEHGIGYANKKWWWADDSKKYGSNSQYNAVLRTTTYELTKASFAYLDWLIKK